MNPFACEEQKEEVKKRRELRAVTMKFNTFPLAFCVCVLIGGCFDAHVSCDFIHLQIRTTRHTHESNDNDRGMFERRQTHEY